MNFLTATALLTLQPLLLLLRVACHVHPIPGRPCTPAIPQGAAQERGLPAL
jgi:hypothetical protein